MAVSTKGKPKMDYSMAKEDSHTTMAIFTKGIFLKEKRTAKELLLTLMGPCIRANGKTTCKMAPEKSVGISIQSNFRVNLLTEVSLATDVLSSARIGTKGNFKTEKCMDKASFSLVILKKSILVNLLTITLLDLVK